VLAEITVVRNQRLNSRRMNQDIIVQFVCFTSVLESTGKKNGMKKHFFSFKSVNVIFRSDGFATKIEGEFIDYWKKLK
jgi:hypothetical protein